jgi:hypothetical protein
MILLYFKLLFFHFHHRVLWVQHTVLLRHNTACHWPLARKWTWKREWNANVPLNTFMLYDYVKITSDFLFQAEHEPFHFMVMWLMCSPINYMQSSLSCGESININVSTRTWTSVLKKGQLLKIMTSVGHFPWQTNETLRWECFPWKVKKWYYQCMPIYE